MAPVPRFTVVLCLCAILPLTLLNGCGNAATPIPPDPTPTPLSASNVNLIFVASEDLAYHQEGDLNPATANLSNRGLQRALRMATYLKQAVLGGHNVNAIYALEPMTHLQTAANLPDLVPLETMQQFSILNQIQLSYPGESALAASSYAINVSYSAAPLPDGVATPLLNCPATGAIPEYSCQGLDFRDKDGENEALLRDIIKQKQAGFYVFSAPWETITTLMANLSGGEGYKLTLPSAYVSPNYVYAISITPSGDASLVTYNSNLNPPMSYPTLPAGGIVSAACLPATTNTTFRIQITGGVGGAVAPAGINTNETVYFIRHAEAHPQPWWEDGNYVGPGQWRALDLPYALAGKIQPTQVYSIDPAQVIPGSTSVLGSAYSYVRTDMTAAPYAIANGLPFGLAASFEMAAQNPPQLATVASGFFFFNNQFSNQKLLVAWEHDHIPPTVNALLATYHADKSAPDWPDDDYDTVWTVTLDANGNVSVDNATCEGIASGPLPAAPPKF